MFSVSCFERYTNLTDIKFGAVFIFTFAYISVNVYFFLLGVICGYICGVSLECVVCSVSYVLLSF
jgi:hypothetical protein